MGMPKIKISRYSATGGTENAPPVGKYWAGYVEPEDKRWILYIQEDGTPFFFGSRDPETGACTEPPISVRVNGLECYSRHGMGAEVRVEFNPTMGKFLIGTVCGVKFTDYGKVLYDVRFEVPDLSGETPGGSTIIHDVDSAFVSPLDEPEEEACTSTSEARARRFPLKREGDGEEEIRVVPAPSFRTKAVPNPTLMTGPELPVPASGPRETQANFDLDKLAEIWPERYGEMAQAIRASVVEKTEVTCSQLPDGR